MHSRCFEVLLVIAILSMLAAFSWPLFSREREAEELIESARRTQTLIQMCRARAKNESRRYRITFQLDGTLDLRRQRDRFMRRTNSTSSASPGQMRRSCTIACGSRHCCRCRMARRRSTSRMS